MRLRWSGDTDLQVRLNLSMRSIGGFLVALTEFDQMYHSEDELRQRCYEGLDRDLVVISRDGVIAAGGKIQSPHVLHEGRLYLAR